MSIFDTFKTEFSNLIKSNLIDIAQASAIVGYNKASVEFLTKLLAYVTCKTGSLPIEHYTNLEDKLKDAITEFTKIEEARKTDG